MTGPVTPAAIAELVRARTTTLQEAADLIQHYADRYADLQLEIAKANFGAALNMSHDMPLTRVPS